MIMTIDDIVKKYKTYTSNVEEFELDLKDFENESYNDSLSSEDRKDNYDCSYSDGYNQGYNKGYNCCKRRNIAFDPKILNV